MKLFTAMVKKNYTVILLTGDQSVYERASEALEMWLNRLALALKCDRKEALRHAMGSE